MKPAERLKRKLDDVPVKYKGIVERAVRGQSSPRDAIKAQCLECVGYVRTEVTLCTSFVCPLYMYRPYK